MNDVIPFKVPRPRRDDSNGLVGSGKNYGGTFYGVYREFDGVSPGHYQDTLDYPPFGQCLGIYRDLEEAKAFAGSLDCSIEIRGVGLVEHQVVVGRMFSNEIPPHLNGK